MIYIFDNYLPQEDWAACSEHFRGGNWCFPPIDGKTGMTSVWRIFRPEIEEDVGARLYSRLSGFDEISPQCVKRVGINGATPFIDSHIHVDGPPGDWSLIWFGSKEWDADWGGALLIYQDNDCWEQMEVTKRPNEKHGAVLIEYVPNRAVLFPSHLAHIPTHPNESAAGRLRISAALHLRPSESWVYKYIPRVGV